MKRGFLLALAFFTLTGFGDERYSANQEGNAAYRQGKYDRASKAYDRAHEADPDAPRIDYNRGNALFKRGKYDEALAAYERAAATESTELKDRIAFNRGEALIKEGEAKEKEGGGKGGTEYFRKAVSLYKKLAKFHPDDESVARNLEIALEKLRTSEKKQKKKKDKKDKQKKKKKQSPKDDTKKKPDKKKEGDDTQSDQKKKSDAGKEDQKNRGDKKEKEKSNEKKDNGRRDKPKPAPGELSDEAARQIFQAIERDEKKMRNRMKALQSGGATQNEKDW